MERALLLVANRLDRVNGYPTEATEPTMRTSSSDDNAIAWFVLVRTKKQQKEMHTFGEFAEDIIQDRLERITGVSRINVYGGSSKQLEVIGQNARGSLVDIKDFHYFSFDKQNKFFFRFIRKNLELYFKFKNFFDKFKNR